MSSTASRGPLMGLFGPNPKKMAQHAASITGFSWTGGMAPRSGPLKEYYLMGALPAGAHVESAAVEGVLRTVHQQVVEQFGLEPPLDQLWVNVDIGCGYWRCMSMWGDTVTPILREPLLPTGVVWLPSSGLR